MDSGLAWTDLEVGRSFRSPGRTVTETDVVMFAGMTGDYSPMHVDREFAEASPFGERIAHGLLGLSIAHGLMLGRELLGRNAIAFLGLSDWRFRAPILLGDTVHVDFEVVELRVRSTDPGQGVLTFEAELRNQRDEVTQSGRKAILMKTA